MDSSTASSVVGGYEVFLSFRGVDTRQGFTDILYRYLTMAEVRVFRDDDELAIGDKIDSILAGLASSKICIPIFSPKFAESKWCLREVAEMVDLKKTIVPVFYKVSPLDVKLKQGSVYWDDIRKLEGGNHEQIDKWKNALKEAGSIKGRELGDMSYSQFCMELVDKVLSKLGPRKRLEEIDHFTGDANKVRAMELLDMDSSDEVVYVGIHGMGGIGKMTITKLIYNQFLSSFDYCGFVLDVREFSARKCIKSLPGYLYENLQPKSVTPFSQSEQIADRFKNKKVLLILDDVDSCEQIREVARESSWFGLGSRIVLTTRDKKVLEDYAEKSRSEIRYMEMEELNCAWAFELFSRCAFGTDSPPSAYQSLSKTAVAYAGGLPLAITVIAKYLRNKKEAIWEEIIEKLKKAPLKEVKDKLMISYNALEEEQKKIFLDIACLFIGDEYTTTSNIFYMWKACGWCPHLSLEVLQSMSLVKVDKDNKLRMHDQLRDLGRDIVRTKSEGDLTKQSRLWEYDETVEVLKCRKKHKNNIEAIQLGWPSREKYGDSVDADFTSFDNLRYLRCTEQWGRPYLKGNFSLLPQLKWLDYKCNILQTRNLALSNLVILKLGESDVNENWDGWSQIQALKKLKVLDLSKTKVTSTPVFSEYMALERLIMEWCDTLTYIHPSISKLHHLNYLSFSWCRSLENLPGCLGELHALQVLHLEGTDISSLPNSIGRLEKLEHLNLEASSITSLPESLGNLRSLVRLDIIVTNITRLPCSIGGLVKLELDFCDQLHELPELPSSLTELKIDSECLKKVSDLSNLQDVTSLELIGGSSILEWNGSFPSKLQSLTIDLFSISRLPDLSSCSQLSYLKLSCERSLKVLPNMSGLRNLLTLEIESCTELVQIPGIGKLHCLTSLLIKECSALECLENLRELKELKEFNLVGCRMLTEIPGLGELQALTNVRVEDCESLEKLDDLTALEQLKELTLVSCQKLANIPGLENMISLSKLEVRYISSLDIMKKVRYLKNRGDCCIITEQCQLFGVQPIEVPWPSDQLENLSREAEGNRHGQLMGSDPSLYYLPAEQSEAEGDWHLQLMDLDPSLYCLRADHMGLDPSLYSLPAELMGSDPSLYYSLPAELMGSDPSLYCLPAELMVSEPSLYCLPAEQSEAEGDRHPQLMGSDPSLYCLPAEQSEAEDYLHRKRRRY